MSLNLMSTLKDKYHYGQVTNISTIYMLECSIAQEQLDPSIVDICASLDSNAPLEIVFTKVNDYMSRISNSQKGVFCDFIFKHVNVPGLNFTRDFDAFNTDEYVTFFNNNKMILAEYLTSENQVTNVNYGLKLIDQHIKWVTTGSVDDEEVIDLFKSKSLGLYPLMGILDDVSAVTKDIFSKRLQTSSEIELIGYLAVYLLNKYRDDLTVVNGAMVPGGTYIEFKLIDTGNLTSILENEIPDARMSPVPASKDDQHVTLEIVSGSLSEFENKFKSLFDNGLPGYKCTNVQSLIRELLPEAEKVIITPDLIDFKDSEDTIHYERPPYNTQNRERSKIEYIEALNRIIDKVF